MLNSVRGLSNLTLFALWLKFFFPITSLCQSVDEKLKILLEDTESFVLEGEEKQEEGAFNRYADTSDILKYMQGSCVKCVQE